MGILSRLGLAMALLAVTGLAPSAAQGPPRGHYTGRVVEAGSGRPVVAAGVFFVWPSVDDSAGPSAYREAQTDALGDFSIDAAAIDHTRWGPPQLWVYRPGYQLYPDRDVRPGGARVGSPGQPIAIRLIGARTRTERVEALNDLVAVVNRSSPSAGPILVSLIEAEFTHLKTVRSETLAPTQTPPSHAATVGLCDADPKNPPPLPPPRPARAPEPGTYNPYEGRRAPYYGRVVDAESGAALVGAVVVAVWSRRVVSVFHAHSVFHEACDVVADREGRFTIDARSIEANRPSGLEPPVFVVFMPGYSVYGVPGRKTGSERPVIRGDSAAFHDVTIGLIKLTTREERIDSLGGIPYGPPADKIPRYQELMIEEQRRLWPRGR